MSLLLKNISKIQELYRQYEDPLKDPCTFWELYSFMNTGKFWRRPHFILNISKNEIFKTFKFKVNRTPWSTTFESEW